MLLEQGLQTLSEYPYSDLILALHDDQSEVTLPAHRIMLYANSDYFKKMLDGYQEKNEATLKIWVPHLHMSLVIILGFYGIYVEKPDIDNPELEILELECKQYLLVKQGIYLGYHLTENQIPPNLFERYVNVMHETNSISDHIHHIVRNIPENYDINKLPVPIKNHNFGLIIHGENIINKVNILTLRKEFVAAGFFPFCQGSLVAWYDGTISVKNLDTNEIKKFENPKNVRKILISWCQKYLVVIRLNDLYVYNLDDSSEKIINFHDIQNYTVKVVQRDACLIFSNKHKYGLINLFSGDIELYHYAPRFRIAEYITDENRFILYGSFPNEIALINSETKIFKYNIPDKISVLHYSHYHKKIYCVDKSSLMVFDTNLTQEKTKDYIHFYTIQNMIVTEKYIITNDLCSTKVFSIDSYLLVREIKKYGSCIGYHN